MVVKIRSDGVIEDVKLFRYFKGSHKVQNITLFAPFDDSYSIAINFRLPDGSNYTGIMEYQSDWQNDDGLHAWVYPIRSHITSIPGKVMIAFTITKEGQVLQTAIAHFLVEDSIDDEGDIIEIEDPTTLDELLKIIEDKIREEGAKSKVWTQPTEPDTAEYDTWFQPIVESTMMESMSLLQKDPPEIAREEVDLNLQELEKIENRTRAKMAKIPEIEKVNKVEIPEVDITQIDLYAKKEPKIVDVTELSKDNEPLDISEIDNATETIDIDLPEIERDTSINVPELDKEKSQINILEIRKDEDDENSS